MIKFYTNRALSKKLGINLAKWKRWSREFLPPDPLGGMQSGYARQYHPDEAFKITLGGHLVADLKFTIPEAKQILKDLDIWLAKSGFYFDIAEDTTAGKDVERLINRYIIFIGHKKHLHDKAFDFFYTIRGIISNRPAHYKGFDVMEEHYAETCINVLPEASEAQNMETLKILQISSLLKDFVQNLDLDREHYKALS